MKKEILFDSSRRPVYSHLEPIIDVLLEQGNTLARDYRWGENRTGFYCLLQEPIDFALLNATFEIPEFIRLIPEEDAVECDKTWASIRGGVRQK